MRWLILNYHHICIWYTPRWYYNELLMFLKHAFELCSPVAITWLIIFKVLILYLYIVSRELVFSIFWRIFTVCVRYAWGDFICGCVYVREIVSCKPVQSIRTVAIVYINRMREGTIILLRLIEVSRCIDIIHPKNI